MRDLPPPIGRGSTKCWASTPNNRHFRTGLCLRLSLIPGNGILGLETKAPNRPPKSGCTLSGTERVPYQPPNRGCSRATGKYL